MLKRNSCALRKTAGIGLAVLALLIVGAVPVWAQSRKTLTVELFDRGNLKPGAEPVDSNLWTRYIQQEFGDKYGYDVKFVLVPRSREVDQLNILMASGSAPDICFTYDRGVIQNYIKQGGVLDLEAAFDKYGAELKAFLGDDVLQWGRFSGKLYSIPARRVTLTNQGTLIRKDWLDKLGMKPPTNKAEFYQAIKAFKDKDPGNIGKDKIVPYKLATYDYQQLADSFITYSKITHREYRTMSWGFLSPSLSRPGYIEGMRFLNKMYHDGLISLDFFLDKEGKLAKEQIINGRVGAFTCNVGVNFDLFKEMKLNVPSAEYITVDCFEDDRGLTAKSSNSRAGLQIIVPKYSKNVEGVIKYLNWMSDPKVIFYLQNGIEGVHHTMENGLPIMIDTEAAKKDFYSGNNVDLSIIANGKFIKDDATSLRAEAKRFPGYENLFITLYGNSLKNNNPVLPPFETPLLNEAKYSGILNTKWSEWLVRMVQAAPADFDNVYAAGMKEQLDAGEKAIMDEKLQVYAKEFPMMKGTEHYMSVK